MSIYFCSYLYIDTEENRNGKKMDCVELHCRMEFIAWFSLGHKVKHNNKHNDSEDAHNTSMHNKRLCSSFAYASVK